MIIDDPLMEIDQQNWIYQYDLEKAAGGLYDAGWNLPKKKQEEEDKAKTGTGAEVTKPITFKSVFSIPKANAEVNYITAPNGGNDYATSEENLFILGNTPPNTKEIWINNYQLKRFDPAKGTWSYKASTEIGTLKKGENLYEIFAVDEAGGKSKGLSEANKNLIKKFGIKAP